jgi:hypothetical protein
VHGGESAVAQVELAVHLEAADVRDRRVVEVDHELQVLLQRALAELRLGKAASLRVHSPSAPVLSDTITASTYGQ